MDAINADYDKSEDVPSVRVTGRLLFIESLKSPWMG
jgi:hypothetical protein